jgi:hypothetical protein
MVRQGRKIRDRLFPPANLFFECQPIFRSAVLYLVCRLHGASKNFAVPALLKNLLPRIVQKGNFPAGLPRLTFVRALLRGFASHDLPAGAVFITHNGPILDFCSCKNYLPLCGRIFLQDKRQGAPRDCKCSLLPCFQYSALGRILMDSL